MSPEENKELVRRFLEVVLNARQVSAIPEFMVPGSMFAGAFEGFITNYIQGGFPDFHMTIEGIFAEGNEVVVQTTIAAT